MYRMFSVPSLACWGRCGWWKDLGTGKIGQASPGRSLEISCGIDSGGQTRREPWTWDLGYIWLVGEKAWVGMVRETH